MDDQKTKEWTTIAQRLTAINEIWVAVSGLYKDKLIYSPAVYCDIKEKLYSEAMSLLGIVNNVDTPLKETK